MFFSSLQLTSPLTSPPSSASNVSSGCHFNIWTLWRCKMQQHGLKMGVSVDQSAHEVGLHSHALPTQLFNRPGVSQFSLRRLPLLMQILAVMACTVLQCCSDTVWSQGLCMICQLLNNYVITAVDLHHWPPWESVISDFIKQNPNEVMCKWYLICKQTQNIVAGHALRDSARQQIVD